MLHNFLFRVAIGFGSPLHIVRIFRLRTSGYDFTTLYTVFIYRSYGIVEY